MVSTKYLRKPLRGALGNGLRVAFGDVVAVRPRRVGPTETSGIRRAHEIGTTLVVTLGPTIPIRS